ncbi:VOC family protein [Kineococcus sp. NPDC059986]|uniref:VOC family protein n=1 Tax=Kineococcus sp. NPDC059986 TaxID=3155538 RepID=UPI00344B1BFE
MPVRSRPWPAGVPCWAHLDTPDPAASAAFYAAVVGWTAGPPGADGSRVGLVEGHAAAGLGRSEGRARWTLHVAVDDLDAALDRVRAAGGSVVRPPTEGESEGGGTRAAVVADPTGAEVGLLQGGGADWVNGPGGLAWDDLRSTDPAASTAFYAAVLGWTWTELFEGYGTVAAPDAPHPVGGIGPLWGSDPGWLVYVGVPDVDTAVAAATGAGGTVVTPAHDSDYGRMAQLADPHGAVLAVFTAPAGAPQPDR